MMRKIEVLVIAVIMTACSGEIKESKTPGETAVKVIARKVTTVKGTASLHYSGTVEPSQTIPLTFQTTGTVEKVFFEEGDQVKKGQIIATVKAGNDQNVYEAALAKYNQAKDAYDRMKTIHEKGSLTEIKWVEMETNMKQAESQLEIAKSNLDNCIMRAPESGIIGRRNIEPGQSAISPVAPIELVKTDKVLVKISVPENEISRIKKNQKAVFTISALGGRKFEGIITNVGVVADVISRTYEVKITVDNSDQAIMPGMVCDVFTDTGIEQEKVVVPYNAVAKDNEGHTYVFLVSGDRKSAVKQLVTVGDYRESGIEVLSGLTPEQSVVVEGKEKLTSESSIIL